MIFTENVEIREYDLPQVGIEVPVKYYIKLDNGVIIGFINVDSEEEIHKKNFPAILSSINLILVKNILG